MNTLPPELQQLQQVVKKKIDKKKEQAKKFVAFLAVGAVAYGLYYPSNIEVENMHGYTIEKNLYTSGVSIENNGATLKIKGEDSYSIDTKGDRYHKGEKIDTYLADMFAKEANKGKPQDNSIEGITENRIQVAKLPNDIKERIKIIQEKQQSSNTSDKKNTM